ncbi:MAG: RNA-binding S4 domain-containing protein [Myxococcota bacterium]|nr:RNA-binding S4 domain-containing protein [Myxococcota bacterium]
MNLPIRLDQYLKRVGVAQTGGHAKYLIQEGLVCINGEVIVQRGKKLYAGDRVSCEGKEWVVSQE